MRLSSWFHSTRTLCSSDSYSTTESSSILNTVSPFSSPAHCFLRPLWLVLTFTIWVHLDSISVPLFSNRVSDGKLQIFIVILSKFSLVIAAHHIFPCFLHPLWIVLINAGFYPPSSCFVLKIFLFLLISSLFPPPLVCRLSFLTVASHPSSVRSVMIIDQWSAPPCPNVLLVSLS